MLLTFSVSNFRSFREEQTLNLIASKRLKPSTDSAAHGVSIPGTDESALRVAAVYGANGAGKSNLVRAFSFVARLIRQGTSPGKSVPYDPFLFDQEAKKQPTCFELQFLAGDRICRYGFCCDNKRVHEEWLSFYEGRRERRFFARTTTSNGAVKVKLNSKQDLTTLPQKLRALAQVGARPNQLFLTEILNLDDPEAQGTLLRKLVEWFSSTLHIIGADSRYLMLATALAADESFKDFAGRFLNEADTGIGGLRVETEEVPKDKAYSPFLREALEKLGGDESGGETAVLTTENGEEFFLDATKKDVIKTRRITATHKNANEELSELPLSEESDGSQRLLNLLPALYRLRSEGCVFVIDELERSMHPILARKFIEFFLERVPNQTSQLIFTTHESTLLASDLLQRDEIWFTEKGAAGATELYSLCEFNVRKDLKIDKGYLQGRFGAIPFLGGVDDLMADQVAVGEVP